jgi:Transposase IS4
MDLETHGKKSRFEEIKSHLKLCEEDPKNNKDRLWKVLPLIELLNRTFKEHYNPTQDFSIDESILAFTGRLAWKQYCPAKPHPWGIKMFCLVDSNNYLYDFMIYTGKTDGPQEEIDSAAGYGHKLVLNLIRCLPAQGYRCAVDNYFTSIPLAEECLKKGIGLFGTIRSNRSGFPIAVREEKLREKGDKVWRQKANQILVMKIKSIPKSSAWYLIATHHLKLTHQVPLPIRLPLILFSGKPQLLADYRQRMGGVDTHNQMTEQYKFDHKSIKWWQVVFFDLIFRVIVNAWQMCRLSGKNEGNPDIPSLKSFIIDLIDEISASVRSRKRSSSFPSPSTPSPKKTPNSSSSPTWFLVRKKNRSSGFCKVCKASRPSFMCNLCENPVCVECFPQHTHT